MTKKSLDNLGRLQRAALEILWELGEATVHQVRRRLSTGKKLAYTTVLTTLQKLEKAGWLRHRTEGKSYIYRPTRTRAEAGAGSVRNLVRQVFDGDTLSLFQHLIRENDLTDQELANLRKMIDRKRKENQNER